MLDLDKLEKDTAEIFLFNLDLSEAGYQRKMDIMRRNQDALIRELREARRIIKTGSMMVLDAPNAFSENAALREELAEVKDARDRMSTALQISMRDRDYAEEQTMKLRTEVEAMRGVGTYDPCIGCTISPVDCLGSASCHIYALKQMRRETLRKRSVDELIDRLEAAEEGLEKFSPLIEAARDLCMGQFTDSEYGYCCVRDGDYEELREALAALDKGKEGA